MAPVAAFDAHFTNAGQIVVMGHDVIETIVPKRRHGLN